jgi:hypothetical protein
MTNTTVVQSNVPKLEGKKNFRTWDLRIRPLLASRKELAAIGYVPKLKSSTSKKDLADTTIEALAEAERLRKAGITSPDQHVESSGIRAEGTPLLSEPEDPTAEDDEDDKSNDPWRYHKNNDEAVFTLTSHLADHILTKVQGIQSAKLMYDRLQKLYGTTTALQKFILLDKLFNISYASAGNMHKYVGQLDDNLKALDRLGISIDPTIAKALAINRLGSHFPEFQARKRDTDLDKLTLDELFAQMLQEDEVQRYQEGKEALFGKKGSDGKDKKPRGEFHLCSGCNKKVRHKLEDCWVLHPEKKEEWLKKNPDKNKAKKNGKNSNAAAAVEGSAAAPEYLAMPNADFAGQNAHSAALDRLIQSSAPAKPALLKFALSKPPILAGSIPTVKINLTPKHYSIAASCNHQPDPIWIYDTGAGTHVSNDAKMFIEMHDIELKLNGVTGTDRITKMGVVEVPFKLPNGQALIHRLSNVFYVPQCPVNLISASRMKRIGNIILNMATGELFDRTTKEVKALVEEVNDLFEMKTGYEAFAALSTPQASSETWHRRMGHLGYDSLRKLTKVADGIVLSDARELFDLKTFKKPECDPCSRTFAKRKPFGKAPRATKEGELIHVDLVYPIKPIGYDGSKGYMSITDDYDGTVSVHLIKNKPEAAIKLQRFCEYQKSRGKPVLAISSDVESVIKSTGFQNYMEREHIDWRPGLAYHPEQNGMAEINQHVLHLRATALLADAGLPKFL